MNMIARAPEWGDLIRRDRVRGDLYRNPEIFQLELERIWYRTWIYVGHESEIPKPHDFVRKTIGLQPILMTRGQDGRVHLLLNRCTHRGNQLCAKQHGNAINFTCPFHAWNFSSDGRLVGYAFPDGYEGLNKDEHGLGRVQRVASYRGFIFGSRPA